MNSIYVLLESQDISPPLIILEQEIKNVLFGALHFKF